MLTPTPLAPPLAHGSAPLGVSLCEKSNCDVRAMGVITLLSSIEALIASVSRAPVMDVPATIGSLLWVNEPKVKVLPGAKGP